LYQNGLLDRNVNRLFDTKGMNRISGKPLKTRGSGTLGVVGIPCLLLGLHQDSMGIWASRWRGGQKWPPLKGVWTQWSNGATAPVSFWPPCLSNLNMVVTL